jgi:hypothetical protein
LQIELRIFAGLLGRQALQSRDFIELREKNVRAMDALELSIEQEPSHVPDEVIAEIRGRERNGAIELPKSKLKAGDRVQVGHARLPMSPRPAINLSARKSWHLASRPVDCA